MKTRHKLILGVLAVAIGLSSAYLFLSETHAQEKPERLIKGEEVFDQPDEKYLVYFYQDSCPYCQEFKPTIEAYQKQENAWPVYYVDLESKEEQKTWDELNIRGTPTIFGIDKSEGTISVHVWEGVLELEELPLLD